MNISIIGGGPSGIFLSILIKKANPDWSVRIFERNDREIGRASCRERV